MRSKEQISKKLFSLSLTSPLTLAMTSALLLSATSNQLVAAPCTTTGLPILVERNTGTDETEGSLPWAILQANNNPGCDQIEFDPSFSDIQLSSLLTITSPINIIGHGDHLPNISRPSYTAISSDHSNLFISNITISSSYVGVYINAPSDNLEIENVNFEGNTEAINVFYTASTTINNSTFAGNEKGINASFYNPMTTISNSTFENHTSSAIDLSLKDTTSTLTIVDSIFQNNSTNNTGQGSGLNVQVSNASANISISGSVFDNNTVESSGNGAASIFVPSGSLELDIDNSSFTNNAGQKGGGLTVETSNAYIANINIVQSTFSGNNTSDDVGGGILFNTDSTSSSLNISHSTIFDNSAEKRGGGVFIYDNENDPSVNIDNTVIANNTTGQGDPNMVGSVNAISYSWIGDKSGITFLSTVGADTTTDGANEADILKPLAENGALGLTHMPSEGSPLIDAGDPDIEDAPETDQNGLARIYNDVIDIGATETQASDEEDDTHSNTNILKPKKSSGAIQWLLLPLALLGFKRKRFVNK